MTDPASLPNFPPPADEHPMRGRVLDVLQDLEVQPDIDADGDVTFTVNDQNLFIRCHEGELQIMRIFGQWQLPEQLIGQETKALETCNELNLTLNCVKTGIGNGTLAVACDHLMTAGVDLDAAVQIGIQLVLSTVSFWHQRALGLDENGNPVPTSISGGDKTQENADGSVRQRVHQNADGSGNIVVVTFDDPSNANSGYGWTTVWFGPPDATGRNPVTGAQSGTSPTPPPTGMPTSPIGRPAGTGSNPGTGTGTGGTGAGTGTGTSSGTGSCGGTGQAACNTEIDDSAFAGQLAVVSGAASSAVSAANGTGALDQISQIKNGTLISIATDWIPSFKPGPAFSCQDISWQVAISHGPLAGISATKNISFCDKLSSIRDFLSWVIWFGTAIGLVRLFFATVGAYPQHQYGSFR